MALLVSNGESAIGEGGPGVFSRIETRLDRIEDKLDARMSALDSKIVSLAAVTDAKLAALDAKVDGVNARQDRIEGGLVFLRWIGPAGVVALIVGMGKAAGLF